MSFNAGGAKKSRKQGMLHNCVSMKKTGLLHAKLSSSFRVNVGKNKLIFSLSLARSLTLSRWHGSSEADNGGGFQQRERSSSSSLVTMLMFQGSLVLSKHSPRSLALWRRHKVPSAHDTRLTDFPRSFERTVFVHTVPILYTGGKT